MIVKIMRILVIVWQTKTAEQEWWYWNMVIIIRRWWLYDVKVDNNGSPLDCLANLEWSARLNWLKSPWWSSFIWWSLLLWWQWMYWSSLIDENVDIVSYPEVSIGPMPEAAEENHNWLKVLDKMRWDWLKRKFLIKACVAKVFNVIMYLIQ